MSSNVSIGGDNERIQNLVGKLLKMSTYNTEKEMEG
jgi:hypothetical protein